MRLRSAVLLLLLGASASTHAGTAFYDPIYGVSPSTDLTYGTGLVNNGGSTLDLKLDLYRPTDIGNGAIAGGLARAADDSRRWFRRWR